MGYYINQEEAEFTIPKENFSRCLDAIKGLMSHTDKMTAERVLSAETLVDALIAWQWDASLDKDGNIGDIFFCGEKAGSDDNLMNAIAPFVKCGSYIQMRGEEGEVWRWTFKGGKMIEKNAKIVWE